jgi:hypothetical protein
VLLAILDHKDYKELKEFKAYKVFKEILAQLDIQEP